HYNLLEAYRDKVFFFSSRRRHTISYGDWSSDVCSSDLSLSCARCGSFLSKRYAPRFTISGLSPVASGNLKLPEYWIIFFPFCIEIGRASCRERVYIFVVE